MKVRGGGDDVDESSDGSLSDEYEDGIDSDSEGSGEEDEASDSEVKTDNNEASSSLSSLEEDNAQKATQLSQQGRNFGITTALWSSLFFDTLLNKAKRLTLFPVLAAASNTNTASSTALLASGNALASGVAFLLWRDLETRSEMISSDGGGGENKTGYYME